MEFDTEAQFEAVIDSSSLSDVRDDIESELGDVEVQVAAQVDGPSGGSGGGGSGAIVDEFETEHQLSEERNRLLEELVDETEQNSYNRAARMGGGAAGLAMAGVLGVGAMGLSALSEFEWPAMPKLEAPDISPIEVLTPSSIPLTEPDWLPPTVPKPDWLPITVESPGGDKDTPDDTPTNTPNLFDIPWGPTDDGPTDTPSTPRTIPDGIQKPGPVGAPSQTAPPVPGDDTQPGGDGGVFDIGPEEIFGGTIAAGAAGALARGLQGTAGTVGGAARAPWVAAGIPTSIAARSAKRSQNRPQDQQSWFDRIVGDALENTGLGGTSTGAGAATAGTAATSLFTGGQGGDPGRESSTPAKVEHSPTYNVDGLRDLERQMRQDRRELEKEIQQLKNALGGGGGGGLTR